MGATREGREPRVNKSLISIKFVTFFVISGLTALHILNSTKPLLLGLNFEEYRYISILASFISILGPIVVGPLADRFAARNANNYGRTLRILTAIVLLITAIIYACLFAVPDVRRKEVRRPSVSFGCDHNGAVVFQERCSHESTCHHWKGKTGTVNLTNCSYTCQNPTQFESLYNPWFEGSPLPSTEVMSESDYEPDYEEGTATESQRPKRHIKKSLSSVELESMSASSEEASNKRVERDALPKKVFVEPPHLCLTEKSETGETIVKKCHVYTDDTENIVVHSVLRSATNIENDTHSAEWCNYPLDGFQCNVPDAQAKWMIQLKNSTKCKPMIECEVINPYDSRESVLADSQCIVEPINYINIHKNTFGYNSASFNTSQNFALAENYENNSYSSGMMWALCAPDLETELFLISLHEVQKQTESTLLVKWDQQCWYLTFIEGYYLAYCEEKAGSCKTKQISKYATSHEITELQPSSLYKITIRTFYNDDLGPISEAVEAKTKEKYNAIIGVGIVISSILAILATSVAFLYLRNKYYKMKRIGIVLPIPINTIENKQLY